MLVKSLYETNDSKQIVKTFTIYGVYIDVTHTMQNDVFCTIGMFEILKIYSGNIELVMELMPLSHKPTLIM